MRRLRPRHKDIVLRRCITLDGIQRSPSVVVLDCGLTIVTVRGVITMRLLCALVFVLVGAMPCTGAMAAEVPVVETVEGQPLAANVTRLIQAMEYLGTPLPRQAVDALADAGKQRDAVQLQELLDERVAFVVSLNPEVRVKVSRGAHRPRLQQAGFTPTIVKVLNDSTVTRELRVESPQAGAVYSGASLNILKRQAQTELNNEENTGNATDRFLSVEMFHSAPMTRELSGLEVEYAIVLIYSHESGRREATIGFDVGAGTQDIGFRGEVPVLFDIRPAVPVKLSIRDRDGTPTAARLTFRDRNGRVYPPQAKRLAPDFFFQPHIYRHDGESVLLPPGEFTMQSCRGPEYRLVTSQVTVPATGPATVSVALNRWIDPAKHGFYCGDHHIHGAGCSHYESPTQGVSPRDMFAQVKGEGLNVGCVLTWGPCFDFQRNYFSPKADEISEAMTVLKYDLEISGFGSAALGHVCLLNLSDQTYPGSDGTKTKGWPTWTVPVMRWCKEQGGVTGYPHSAMHVNPPAAAKRMVAAFDSDRSGAITSSEAQDALLPELFEVIDEDRDGSLSERELTASHNRAADSLPNLAVPEMNGGGAMEIFVTAAEGVCDFVSAMDTARIPEWNTWYHLMNCGLPIKLSGETDFPCMSSRRVGQGRVYVQLGDIKQIDFSEWCKNLGRGRSYVSDGYAHALDFTVDGVSSGYEDVNLTGAGTVAVKAQLAFSPEVPKAVAYGQLDPAIGRRMIGDTVNLHAPRNDDLVFGGQRLVEVIVNGVVVSTHTVPADGNIHAISCSVDVEQSSWIAVRQFPQLHTNPVNVIVAEKPIRASADSARWCAEAIKLLWKNRNNKIAEHEREEAHETYQRAIRMYEEIAAAAR